MRNLHSQVLRLASFALLYCVLIPRAYCQNQDQPPSPSFHPNFGLLGGYLITGTPGDTQTGLAFGVRAAHPLDLQWEAGFSYLYFQNNPIPSITNGQSFFLGDINFHLSRELQPLHLGFMTGIGISTSSVSGSPSMVSFAMGVRGNYDHPLKYGISIGPEIRYFMNFSNSISPVFVPSVLLKYTF